MEKVLGTDKTDIAEETRLYCQAAMPDAQAKQEAWSLILNQRQPGQPQQRLSKKMRDEVIRAFNHPNQLDLTASYNELYFGQLHDFYKGNIYKLFVSFFYANLPRKGEITEGNLQKLRDLRAGADVAAGKSGGEASFKKVLSDGIEQLERQKLIRELAQRQDDLHVQYFQY